MDNSIENLVSEDIKRIFGKIKDGKLKEISKEDIYAVTQNGSDFDKWIITLISILHNKGVI